jgi:hypothetical protein
MSVVWGNKAIDGKRDSETIKRGADWQKRGGVEFWTKFVAVKGVGLGKLVLRDVKALGVSLRIC